MERSQGESITLLIVDEMWMTLVGQLSTRQEEQKVVMLQLLTMGNMDHGHYMRFWNRGHDLYAGSTAGYGAGGGVHPQQACSRGLVGEGLQLEGGAGGL